VAGSGEFGDEPPGSGAKELVTVVYVCGTSATNFKSTKNR
jgi:hypothetical protein